MLKAYNHYRPDINYC